MRVARAGTGYHVWWYDVYVVRRENVTGSLQIMFMGRGGGKSWNKGSMCVIVTMYHTSPS